MSKVPKKETKRAQKEKPESKDISWKAVLAILGGITTFMSGVLTWLDFIIHLQSGYKIFLWAGIFLFIVVDRCSTRNHHRTLDTRE